MDVEISGVMIGLSAAGLLIASMSKEGSRWRKLGWLLIIAGVEWMIIVDTTGIGGWERALAIVLAPAIAWIAAFYAVGTSRR